MKRISKIKMRNVVLIITSILMINIINSCIYIDSTIKSTAILSETKLGLSDTQTNTNTLITTIAVITPTITDQFTSTNTNTLEPIQWTNITPNGGIISDLNIDPLTTSILYALTKIGLFKSIDNGENWKNIGNPDAINLTIDPVTPSIIYANSQHDLKKSTDSGKSWNVISDYGGEKLAIDSSNTNILYRITYKGLMKSINGGEEWFSLNLVKGAYTDIAIDPLTTTTLYIGGSGGCVYKSIDGGEKWVEVKFAIKNITNQTISYIAINPVTPTTLYVGIFGDGVYKSTNGGASWKASNNGLPHYYFSSLTIDPVRPSIIYSGTWQDGIYKSINGGIDWRKMDTGGVHDEIRSLVIDPKNTNTVYAGTIGGVIKSQDIGENWISINSGISMPSIVQSIAVDPKTPTILYSGISYRGIYKSMDSGKNWNEVYIGGSTSLFPFIIIDPNNPSNIYVRHFEYLMKSSDGGKKWAFIGNFSGEHGPELNYLAIDPLQTNILYASIFDSNHIYDGIILKSINGGETWQWLKNGLPENSMVMDLAIDYTQNNVIYAGTWGNGVYKSIDGGENWIAINKGLLKSKISSLRIDPLTPSIIYVGTSGEGIYKSIDNGMNWSEINTGLPDNIEISDLIINPINSNILFICINGPSDITTSGVYESINAGKSWSFIGLSDSKVNDLAINPEIPAIIYAATEKGLYYYVINS
jgi:photosystem II stability/assembly factor-like uncharacterized protein